jgi:hypothetical protein
MMLAVKASCVLFRDTPANTEQAFAAPAQVVAEFAPLPRLMCKYSADIDHAPFNPISAPAPAAHPEESKFLPPPKEAIGAVAPGGVNERVLLCDPVQRRRP